ncbi:MAG: hypothetical protein N3E49_00075 [Bacteroidia bacterium]|nr:hypothetical protein [Bacteroidia bacterium]
MPVGLHVLKIAFVLSAVKLSICLAQNPQIKRILDKAQLSYTVDEEGDFRMTFEVSNERTQMVFILSKVEQFGEESIVEIWSPAYKGSEVSRETLLLLSTDGTKRKVGGWEIVYGEGLVYAIFKVKVPLSSLKPTFIRSVCAGVAGVADEIEQQVTGGMDEF